MNAQQGIRLLLADVDGTLVTPDTVLTEATKAVARELRQAGIVLAITSSRPPRGMRELIESLDLQSATASFNGGVFVNPDLSVIESHRLDLDTAKQTVKLILDQGLDVWVYTEDEWLIRDQDAPHVARETRILRFNAKTVASFTDAHLERAVKIVGISDELDLVAACEKLTREALGVRASAARSQPYYLDVTHPQANKGAVVTTLSKLLNIPAAQIATIGDMPSDVLMFHNSGFSIAMGNSSDEVKAQARAVTDSNENEGFAKAVWKFILRPVSVQLPRRVWSPALTYAITRPTIIVVMGVSGSGKTTISTLLAAALGCQFQEGDDLHPRENVEKMRVGTLLTDADRMPWLYRIAEEIDSWRARGESGVLTCSALKQSYRDTIIGDRPDVTLVYLKGSHDTIRRRMAARHEHFMPVALLDSQFATLQEPTPAEHPITVDVSGRPAEIAAEIVRRLKGRQSGGRPDEPAQRSAP
jgi:carbohydrate kinase (thermoresistant glucokinase family)/Cof subfamily protein (haloacid dehalogenase superfamily)